MENYLYQLISVAFMADLFFPASAYAVESNKSSAANAAEKWAVVGVISDSTKPGIAVLKNNQTGRTYTIEEGEALPTDYSFKLESIANRKVIIGDGKLKVQLSFAESGSDENELPSRTARFLDNYYRGFGDSSIDILSLSDLNTDTKDTFNEPTYNQNFSSFGMVKGGDSRRPRFDIYEDDKFNFSNPNSDSERIIDIDPFSRPFDGKNNNKPVEETGYNNLDALEVVTKEMEDYEEVKKDETSFDLNMPVSNRLLWEESVE